MEAYSEFCSPLPTLIFIDLLGFPREDTDFFVKYKDSVLRPEGDTPEAVAAGVTAANEGMRTYLSDLMESRRRGGAHANDLLSGMMEMEVDGLRLTDEQIHNIVKTLIIAGLDTVTASLSCFFMFLGRNPEYQAQLADDLSHIPSAVEKLLRHQSPLQQGVRKATVDLVLPCGEEIKAGEIIQTMFAAANLDEEEFPDAQTVDFHRSPNRHIAFASGFHRCLGSTLARMELQIIMEEWTKRIPEFSVTSVDELEVVNVGVRTIFNLPLTFRKA